MRFIVKLNIVTFILFLNFSVSYAEAASQLLATYTKDVTGDQRLEKIELFGIPLSPKSNYYQHIYALITSETEQWRINYHGGYDPVILFKDLNHDGINDLSFQSRIEKNSEQSYSQLHTITQKKLVTIPLPEHNFITGQFSDDFYAEIKLNMRDKPMKVNVESNKEDYVRLNLYDKLGNVKKAQQLLIEPMTFFTPFYISEGKGFGLKSYQQISGVSNKNRLGAVETLWYYEGKQWIKVQSEWKAAE